MRILLSNARRYKKYIVPLYMLEVWRQSNFSDDESFVYNKRTKADQKGVN